MRTTQKNQTLRNGLGSFGYLLADFFGLALARFLRVADYSRAFCSAPEHRCLLYLRAVRFLMPFGQLDLLIQSRSQHRKLSV